VAALKARPYALATHSPQEALAVAEARIAHFNQMLVEAPTAQRSRADDAHK
jgi:hypothetical protein